MGKIVYKYPGSIYLVDMYVRCRANQAKNKWRVMICRSIQRGSKVVQEIVKYLGAAHSEDQKRPLVRLGQIEIRKLTTLPELTVPSDLSSNVFLNDVVEVGRAIEGMHEIFGAMVDRINLRGLLKPYQYERLKNLVI